MIPRWHNLIIGIVCLGLGLYLMTFVGCAPHIPSSTSMQMGQEVSEPYGWTDYCTRYPADPSCGGVK